MAYYPIFLELRGRACLVIGGGVIATQKTKALIACGGKITVVSPTLGAGLTRLLKERRIRWRRHRLTRRDLKGMELVVAATDDQPVNKQAARWAKQKGLLINVVDQPSICSFIVPSVVRRGKLCLAISTSGVSPALSKWIRKDLERRYGSELGKLLARSSRIRGALKDAVPSYNRRKRLYEEAIDAYFRVMKMSLRGGRRPRKQSQEIASPLRGSQ